MYTINIAKMQRRKARDEYEEDESQAKGNEAPAAPRVYPPEPPAINHFGASLAAQVAAVLWGKSRGR